MQTLRIHLYFCRQTVATCLVGNVGAWFGVIMPDGGES